jgi:hypothetical protein
MDEGVKELGLGKPEGGLVKLLHFLSSPSRDSFETVSFTHNKFQLVLKKCAIETQTVLALADRKQPPVEIPLLLSGCHQVAVAFFFGKAIGFPLLRNKLFKKLARVPNRIIQFGRRNGKEFTGITLGRSLRPKSSVKVCLANSLVLGLDVIEQGKPMGVTRGEMFYSRVEVAARAPDLEEIFIAASEDVDEGHFRDILTSARRSHRPGKPLRPFPVWR